MPVALEQACEQTRKESRIHTRPVMGTVAHMRKNTKTHVLTKVLQ